MIVLSAGRVGSHSLKGWLHSNGHPEAFVLHARCLDNGHTLPLTLQYDPEKPPEGLSPERLARIHEEAVVPVRNPVDRAVSAWRYFHRASGRIEQYTHALSDKWWERQYRGEPIVRVEDEAWWEERPRGKVEIPERLAKVLREGYVARTFYSESEIQGALDAYQVG